MISLNKNDNFSDNQWIWLMGKFCENKTNVRGQYSSYITGNFQTHYIWSTFDLTTINALESLLKSSNIFNITIGSTTYKIDIKEDESFNSDASACSDDDVRIGFDNNVKTLFGTISNSTTSRPVIRIKWKFCKQFLLLDHHDQFYVMLGNCKHFATIKNTNIDLDFILKNNLSIRIVNPYNISNKSKYLSLSLHDLNQISHSRVKYVI